MKGVSEAAIVTANFQQRYTGKCSGIKINPIKMSLIEEAQNNFRKFLSDDGTRNEYCNVLKGIVNNKENIIKSEGLIGFFFPKINPKIEINGVYNNHLIPTAFVHTANDGLNSFYIQSYHCAVHNNVISSVGKCDHCNSLNKNMRRKDPGFYSIPKKLHNKELKTLNSVITKSNEKITELQNTLKSQKTINSKTLNKCRKMTAY